MDMLTEKYSQKAEIKKDELELRKMELAFAKEKYAAEAEERQAKLEMEMQERRAKFSAFWETVFRRKKEKENVYSTVLLHVLVFYCE